MGCLHCIVDLGYSVRNAAPSFRRRRWVRVLLRHVSWKWGIVYLQENCLVFCSAIAFHFDRDKATNSVEILTCILVSLLRRHTRSQGWVKGAILPKFLENIVILCFERRFYKQNSVNRLKSNILSPPKFFGSPNILGWLRHSSSPLQKMVAHYNGDNIESKISLKRFVTTEWKVFSVSYRYSR